MVDMLREISSSIDSLVISKIPQCLASLSLGSAGGSVQAFQAHLAHLLEIPSLSTSFIHKPTHH